MTKTPVKFQKNRHKTVGGVAPTRYPLFIHIVIDNVEKWLSLSCEKGNTNNLRIISKPHAYLQTITETPVKFQKNRYRTVGGAAPTGGWKDRRMDGWKEIRTERWIGKNKVTPLFFEKAGNSKLAANVS